MRGHLCKDLKAGNTLNLEGISQNKTDPIFSKHVPKHGNDRHWLVGGRVFQSDPDSLMFTMQYNTCLI